MRVSTSQFKAKLGVFMKAVREGKEVVVTDRDEPVARLVPFERERGSPVLTVSQPRDPTAPPLGTLTVRSIRYAGPSTTTWLREDRRRR